MPKPGGSEVGIAVAAEGGQRRHLRHDVAKSLVGLVPEEIVGFVFVCEWKERWGLGNSITTPTRTQSELFGLSKRLGAALADGSEESMHMLLLGPLQQGNIVGALSEVYSMRND